MLNSTYLPVRGVGLNVVSSIFEIIALTVSSILLSLTFCRLYLNYVNKAHVKHNIPIILAIDALCLHVMKSIVQFTCVNFTTIKRDFAIGMIESDSLLCRLCSYQFFATVSALYWSYVLQAVFRFTRVLYPKCSVLHQSSTYFFMFIPGQVILSYGTVLPLLVVFDSMRLVPQEAYCSISMEEHIPLAYFLSVIFGLPISIIVVCYTCLLFKIRLLIFTNRFQQKHQRDYIAIRRITLIIAIVSLTSVPAIIDLIFYQSNGRIDPLIYRLQWFSSSLNSIVFTISLPFVNPQLLQFLKAQRTYEVYNNRVRLTKQTVSEDL